MNYVASQPGRDWGQEIIKIFQRNVSPGQCRAQVLQTGTSSQAKTSLSLLHQVQLSHQTFLKSDDFCAGGVWPRSWESSVLRNICSTLGFSSPWVWSSSSASSWSTETIPPPESPPSWRFWTEVRSDEETDWQVWQNILQRNNLQSPPRSSSLTWPDLNHF